MKSATSRMADDLSIALLLTLERLSPLERAAFLLHDVFEMDHADIGRALGRTEEACRQLAARARQHVRQARPRFAPTDQNREKLFAAFEAVMTSGDVAGFAQVLADDAVLYADGGGKRAAVLGLPGFVVHAEDGVQTTAFEVEGDQIVALYVVRNPDKLRHVVS